MDLDVTLAVDFLTLSALLGRSLVDKRAQAVFLSLGKCTNIEDLGSLFKKFEDSGVCFLAEEKPKAKRGWRRRGGRLITTIWLYSKEYPGYDEYLGTLPGSVKFGDSKDSVIEKLGNPWKVVIRKLPEPSIQLQFKDTNLALNCVFDDSEQLLSVAIGKPLSEQEMAKIKWRIRCRSKRHVAT